MTAQLLKGVDHKSYHQDLLPGSPRFSRSAARMILQSPLACYAWHPRLGNVPEDAEEEDEKEDRKAGSIYHELLLGGGLGLAVCDFDAFRSNEAKKAKAEALANGLVPIVRAKYEAALVHARKIRARLEEEGIVLAEFETEVTGLWDHGETPCKTRLDGLKLGEGRIVDLKCVKAVSLRSFVNRIPVDGLDMQAFTQACAVEAAHPAIAGRVKHDFVVCQIVPPYDIMITSLHPTMLSHGELRWNRALKSWRRSLTAQTHQHPEPKIPDGGTGTVVCTCGALRRFAFGKPVSDWIAWPGIGRVPDVEAKEWQLTEEMSITTTAAGDPAWTKGD